jgi:hypothetical protein
MRTGEVRQRQQGRHTDLKKGNGARGVVVAGRGMMGVIAVVVVGVVVGHGAGEPRVKPCMRDR